MNVIKEDINKIRKYDLTKFNYNHDISHFDLKDQIVLWCLRTLLFYQLLVISTIMMSDETVFNNVYSHYTIKRVFKNEIVNELPNFKMGIFGSITPTSDIDIGIQYSGNNTEIAGLSYIVSVFEDLFLIFTGLDSLHFDIETYADMMTIPSLDEKTKDSHPDVFYLDTTHFEEKDFQLMIPYIESSILRNYVTAQLDIGNKNSINTIIASFSYSEFDKNISGIPYEIKTQYLKNIDFSRLNQTSIDIVSDYLNSSYNDAREKYYKYVEDAEASVIEVRKMYNEKGIE
jgi:hypothetical protein